MSWTTAFRTWLGRRALQASFVVRTIDGLDTPGGAWQASSVPREGYDAILVGPPQITGSSVSPRSWSSSSPSFTLRLAGTHSQLRTCLQAVVKGSLIEVVAVPAGWDVADGQRIAVGQVAGGTLAGRSLSLECVGLLEALRSRITTDSDNLALFANAGQSTALTVGYVPGDGTLTVTPGTAETVFERESGGTGLCRVDSTVTNTSFYLTYTGNTPDTLTGVTTSDVYGTTRAAANAGDAVSNVVLLEGHPITLLQRLLVSTGTGAHGTFDTYPETWGYGLDDDLVALDDMSRWRNNAVVPSSGTYAFEVIVDSPVTNGLDYLRGLLSKAGVWLTLRQGQITARAAQDPDAYFVAAAELDLADWSQVHTLQLWASSSARSARRTRVYGVSESQAVGAGAPTALPCDDEAAVDLSTVVWSNQTVVLSEIAGRLAPWYGREGDRLNGVPGSMQAAELCEGDMVLVDGQAKKLWTRVEAQSHGEIYVAGRPALVTAVSPDWEQWSTGLTLELLPTSDEAVPV